MKTDKELIRECLNALDWAISALYGSGLDRGYICNKLNNFRLDIQCEIKED